MEQLKRKRNTFRIKRYYSIKINDGRGYLASIVDKFIFRMFIFLTLFIYSYINLKNVMASIIISSILVSIYFALSHRLNSKRFEKNIKIINEELIIEKIYTNLMNRSKDSYVDYVKEIMSHYGIKNMKKTIRRDLDIIGEVGGEEVGIKCYQYNEDHKVDRNDIKNFFIEIRDNHIKKGIVITTSSFLEEAQTFFNNIETVDISFLTIENIMDIIKETSLYPQGEDIEKMILKKLNETKIRVKDEGRKIISKDNTKSCVVSGVVILLFSKFTIFKMYYKIFGVILISLGLTPIIKLIVNLILVRNIEDES